MTLTYDVATRKKVLSILHARELYKQGLVFEFDTLKAMTIGLQHFNCCRQFCLIEVILKLLKARLHRLS